RGLGFATAHDLGHQGITVILGVRDVKKGQDAVKELQAHGIKAEAVAFDASKPETFSAIRDHIANTYGKLDILVNNAGVFIEEMGGNNTITVSQKILKDTFNINFFSVIELTQTLLPLLEKAPSGRIVNLSSILGSLGLHSDPDSPIAGSKNLAYNASKAALNVFTIHLADALRGTKIKVNSAHPGWVKTDMGGEQAPMNINDGIKTSVQLATLNDNGPNGRFIHMGEALPW
ncbi:MAG TPA: SDR family oxidoreductase, partial [Alphaproteobacteria bacterium]